jgi:hypothetical protein
MTFSKHSQNGITLIELPIYMGLLAILLLVFTNILVTTLDTFTSSESTASVSQDGRYIYSRFIYDIHRADSITLPANPGDTGNSLAFSVGGTNYSYMLNNGNLIMTDQNGPSQLNSFDTTVSSLSFHRIGNIGGKHTIQLIFTIQGKTTGGHTPETRNFQTTAAMR